MQSNKIWYKRQIINHNFNIRSAHQYTLSAHLQKKIYKLACGQPCLLYKRIYQLEDQCNEYIFKLCMEMSCIQIVFNYFYHYTYWYCMFLLYTDSIVISKIMNKELYCLLLCNLGKLIFYYIQRNVALAQIKLVNLTSYTNYSVRVSACTVACSLMSSPVQVLTSVGSK